MLLLISGCALQPADTSTALDAADTPANACRVFINELEKSIAINDVTDAAAARIDGFPYLRSNRLLASFRDELTDRNQFEDWLDGLQQLGLEGWLIEWQNLPAAEQQRLNELVIEFKQADIPGVLTTCSHSLRQIDLQSRERKLQLRTRAKVADNYNSWQRILGLYPLSSLAFRFGVANWHAEARALFATDRDALAVNGKLERYWPRSDPPMQQKTDMTATGQQSSVNTLGIPMPGADELQRLFARHAPVFEIDSVRDDDRIGAVVLDQDLAPVIDTANPVVYRYITHTRFHEQVLLQLNYMLWFPARTKTSALDLLGGNLDGIIWRVTLLPNGRPLLYDTIHNCGCYHLFFPEHAATIKTTQSGYEEPLLFVRALPFEETKRVLIRLASGTHYIQHVGHVDKADSSHKRYELLDANSLRTLQNQQGRRSSMYGPDGIVASSARGERYFFWPMGVPSAGSMRQPGTHATAFIGRRHFDDARLFEPYLEIDQTDQQ